MNFIQKIFLKEIDKEVHLQFQKFSRGIFKNKSLITARKTKKKYSISTGYEFANWLVKKVAEKVGDRRTNFKGAIISTQDLTGELDFNEKKQFQGVKKYLIDKEMSGNEVLALLGKFPKAFFALSFQSDDSKLKIKPKAPKSGKPKNKEGEILKASFCKITTTDENIGRGFVFEQNDFKKANIRHTYIIEEIIIPEELKDSKDFSLIREESRRKGKIIRIADIDGKEIKKEIEFEA